MPRFAWLLLLVFSTVLAQVQPVGATMRIPAPAMACCGRDHPCTDHDQPGAPAVSCTACVVCAPGGHLAVLTTTVIPGAVLAATKRTIPADEIGRQWRDPPPLPPPRHAA